MKTIFIDGNTIDDFELYEEREFIWDQLIAIILGWADPVAGV